MPIYMNELNKPFQRWRKNNLILPMVPLIFRGNSVWKKKKAKRTKAKITLKHSNVDQVSLPRLLHWLMRSIVVTRLS